jgi:hypothetical protein
MKAEVAKTPVPVRGIVFYNAWVTFSRHASADRYIVTQIIFVLTFLATRAAAKSHAAAG